MLNSKTIVLTMDANEQLCRTLAPSVLGNTYLGLVNLKNN